MDSLVKTHKVPLEMLEDQYWQEAGFCLSCGEFSPIKVEPGLSLECPFCKKETLYDVDFLMKKEILLSID